MQVGKEWEGGGGEGGDLQNYAGEGGGGRGRPSKLCRGGGGEGP